MNRPISVYSRGSCMEIGSVRRWHLLNYDGSKSPEIFNIRRVETGYLVHQSSGDLIGCFAGLDAARNAGFAWLERQADQEAR